jgi:hypothetical protein
LIVDGQQVGREMHRVMLHLLYFNFYEACQTSSTNCRRGRSNPWTFICIGGSPTTAVARSLRTRPLSIGWTISLTSTSNSSGIGPARSHWS